MGCALEWIEAKKHEVGGSLHSFDVIKRQELQVRNVM